MFNKDTTDAIGAWRYNINPNTNGCRKYNQASLSFKIPNLDLTISGRVIWDGEADAYVFHFYEHNSPSGHFGVQRDFAMYDKKVHQYIMDTFRVQFGIFRTNGMYIIPEQRVSSTTKLAE